MSNPFKGWGFRETDDHAAFIHDEDGVDRMHALVASDAERFLAMAKAFGEMKEALVEARPAFRDYFDIAKKIDAALAAAEAIGDPPTP